MIRTGLGYDLHRLIEGRPLILGGIVIPFEKGEDGHSDGDVLFHAITDALLGAHLGEHGAAAPFFRHEVIVSQFRIDTVNIGVGLVNLVYGYDHWNTGST